MSVDGVWDAVVESPMGAQKSTFTLKAQDGKVTGNSAQPAGGLSPVLNGKIDGGKVSWSVDVTTPMKMTVDFEGTVAGDKIAGFARPGMFGKFPFTATKRA